jgi:hypothetical protein
VNGTYLGEIKFESGLYVEKTGLSLSGPFSTFSLSNANSQHSGALLNFGNFSQQYRSDRSILLQYGDTNFSSAGVYTVGEQNVMSFIFDSTSLGYYNGTEVINDAATGATATQFRVGNSSFGLDGDVKEIIIYNSNQSANRTAIEANIGETYGITDIPAANDTVNGFVQTWYDQSGSVPANDAEQTTAANQPKIVGEVTSGQPHAFLGAIDFDGTNDFFVLTTSLTTQPYNTFSVYSATVNSSFIYSGSSLPAAGRRGTGQYVMSHGVSLAGGTHPSTEILATYLANGASSEIFSNGTSIVSGDAGNTSNTIAYVFGRPANAFGGTAKEMIIYNSDQSSNRPAIEANIANQYGITLS